MTSPEASTNPPRGNVVLLNVVFGLVMFASAYLLFQVQPLISKAILPWFGGTPAVWNTCLLFFQITLFGGYLYAHFLSTKLVVRTQLIAHGLLLLLACIVLPIRPNPEWKPDGTGSPILEIVLILAASVGLPFFVLSTTSPLLQHWFSKSLRGRSPYHLYALSNVGSLLGLLCYPFVVEPLLTLGQQSALFSFAFILCATGCVCCALSAFRSSRNGQDTTTRLEPVERSSKVQTTRPEISDHIDWILLAIVPSIMLLATTNQVCLDVATIPFLWVLPLTLYLLSFIIAFAGKWWYPRKLWMIVLPPFLLLTIAAMLVGADEVRLGIQFVVYFGALFATSMFCHGELVRLKPNPKYLTNFYLCMSAGGAMGGLFVGLVVPYIFDLYLELHVAIIAAQFLLIWIARCEEHRLWRNLLVGWSFLFLIYSPVLLICEVQDELKESKLTKRSFYGVVRIHESKEIQQLQLYNGHIQHGSQFRSHALRRVPTLYYARSSAAGLAIESLPSDQPRHFGLVGLGCGTIAAYATELDRVTCYEINNQVLRIAGRGGSVVGDDGTELSSSDAMTSPFNEYYFTYVEDCPGDVFLVPGDARTSLDRQPTQNFDILVLDAFSSDAIPIHLLTKEAFEIYLRHMKPNGVIAVHVSNLHFDLPPVLLGIADEFGLIARYKDDQSHDSATWPSQWVLLSTSEQPFNSPLLSELGPIEGAKRILWTDDFSSLADLLMERQWGEGEGGLLTLLRELDVAKLFSEGNTSESTTGK